MVVNECVKQVETGKKLTKQDRRNMKNDITYEEQDDKLPWWRGYSENFHIRRLGGLFGGSNF